MRRHSRWARLAMAVFALLLAGNFAVGLFQTGIGWRGTFLAYGLAIGAFLALVGLAIRAPMEGEVPVKAVQAAGDGAECDAKSGARSGGRGGQSVYTQSIGRAFKKGGFEFAHMVQRPRIPWDLKRSRGVCFYAQSAPASAVKC